MRIFTTTIQAIDPLDGEMKTWEGPHINGISYDDAKAYCKENGLGYCEVDGEFIGECDSPDEFPKIVKEYNQVNYN